MYKSCRFGEQRYYKVKWNKRFQKLMSGQVYAEWLSEEQLLRANPKALGKYLSKKVRVR